MQRGACEALSLGRPIITSDWPLLRTYFNRGAVHVDATVPEIRDGVRRIRDDHDHYQYEIGQLQAAQRAEWATASTTLEEVTGISVNGGQKRDS